VPCYRSRGWTSASGRATARWCRRLFATPAITRGIARVRDAYESVAVQGAAWCMVDAARGVRGICSAAVAAALKHTERPPRSG